MSSLTSTTNFEVNGSSGADTNGGGFDATISGGTDYTQGAGAKTIVFDGVTIKFTTAGAASTITVVGYTVLTTDVGNVLQTTGGTNVTTGFWTITSVSTGSNTWTFGANVTTGATSNGQGTAGGALASPGMVPGSALTSTNITFIKGNHTYSLANSAGSGGKVSNAGGCVCGYNTTRSLFNQDANLPVLQSTGSNSYTLITVANPTVVSSLVFANANANTGITCVSDQSNTGSQYFNIQGTSVSVVLNINSNGGRADFIAAINCTGGAPIETTGGTGTIFSDCVVSGGGGLGQGGGSYAHNCIVASSGSAATGGDFAGFTECTNCISYNHTRTSVPAFAGAAGTRFVNCIIHSATGTGAIGISPSTDVRSAIINCAFYNNTTDVGTLGHGSNVGKISLTADPFTNAAGGDFSLNNTAGGGAALRAAGWPSSLPGISTSNYLDVGAVQHASTASTTVVVASRRKVR